MAPRLFVGVYLLLICLSGAGCAGLSSNEPAGDRDLAAAIQLRLSEDSIAGAQSVRVTVDQGVASLSGRLSDPGAKARVMAIVRGTPEIKGVVDNTTR